MTWWQKSYQKGNSFHINSQISVRGKFLLAVLSCICTHTSITQEPKFYGAQRGRPRKGVK